MKSKLLFFAVFFVVLPYICFSYEEIYIGSNGNKLKLGNTLPDTFPKIGKVEDLGKLFEKIDEKNGLPNAELWIELRGNDLLFLFETREKHFFGDLYSSGSLYLLPCYYYLKNINVWFFDGIRSLNDDRPSIMEDLRAFNIQYWFTLMKDGNYIQVEGKVGPVYSSLYRQTIADMILYEPLFVKYNGENFKAYSDIYFREKYFYEFQLSSPYNSITKEYYPSYFVYLFFDDNNAIKNVPPYYGGNLLSPVLTGKWKGILIKEPNNYIVGEYYGNNNIILTAGNDTENSMSIAFELLNRQLLNLYIRTDNDEMTIKFQKEKSINGTSNSLISNILSGTWAVLDIDAVAKADYNGDNILTLHGESEDEIFIVRWDLMDKDTLFIAISDSDNDVSTILFTRIKE